MSNSSLVIYTQISPNKTMVRNHKIDTITIHCVVGQVTAETLGRIFYNPEHRASSNYGVDKDGRVGLYVEEKDRSWCSSSASNDNRAVTIEVASDTLPPYKITDKAYRSLISLCEDICRRHGIDELRWKGDKSLIGQVDKQNMTVHRWFANKSCPGDYLYNLHGQIAEEVNVRLRKDDGEMTQEEFNQMFTGAMLEYRKTLQAADQGEYSKDACDWAIANGILKGDAEGNLMYGDFLTREQAMVLLHRTAKLLGIPQ